MAEPKLEKFLPFAPPLVGQEEIDEVADTLRSGWLTTGPKTERFEKEMSAFIGAEEALAVNSATAALHLALNVLEVGPGQGVITTPLTFASTAHVIKYQGARPYLADVGDDGNLDPAAVARFLSEECRRDETGRPRHHDSGDLITTLLPVHYGGRPVDLDAFWDIATEYRLNIVEDAAHAVGAEYKALPIGHPGRKPAKAAALKNLTAFSFYATKNMTTGEGGLLTADDPALLAKARIRGMYGISDSRRIWGRYAPKGTWVYDVAELGFKYNFTDIQACLGLHQLRRLPGFIETRRGHAAAYNRALAGLDDLVIRPEDGTGLAWHLYPLRLKTSNLNISRDDFIEALRAANIGTSVLFIPLHYHGYYRESLPYQDGDFPKAEEFFKGLVNLPVSPAHRPEDIQIAARVTADLLKRHRR